MESNDVLLLKANEILGLVDDRESELVEVVREAYLLHEAGDSSLPNSIFLRFPAEPQNRIIALPAYLKMNNGIAGIKWVSSFPHNINNGLDRASAVLILNSTRTGRPKAIMEGAIISAKRTAASACLAAQILQKRQNIESVGIIGCGLINFEIIRFLSKAFTSIKRFILYDNNPVRADNFRLKCREKFAAVEVLVADNIERALGSSFLVTIATTTGTPHISELSVCQKGTVILHISLRDLSPEAILSCNNVVDDVEHVSRAQTSIHLAEELTGNRSFINGTIAGAINGNIILSDDKTTVFSPFGLGILDIAVGEWVFNRAFINKGGTLIKAFLSNFTESDS